MTHAAKALRKIAIVAAAVVLTCALIVLDTRAADPIAPLPVSSAVDLDSSLVPLRDCGGLDTWRL